MTTDRRLYDMDLGRRDHTRWLGSNRYAGSGPPLPLAGILAAYYAANAVTGATLTVPNTHGAGPSATQSTALQQPAKTTHGTLGDVLDFDGTNDNLIITGLSTASTSHTVIVVADMNATTATSRTIIDWQTGRYAWLQEFFSGDNVSVLDSAVRALTAGTVGAQVLTLTNAAGAITLYRARASVGTTTGVARALGGTARIGSDFTGGAPADMQLAALFVWEAALDATARTAAWDHISARWPGLGL